MGDRYVAYLTLLEELRDELSHLTELAQKKIDAVKQDDLMALDLVLKQEQALSLSMRGLEQRQQKQLAELGLADLSLAQLAAAYPTELQLRAKQTADSLRDEFQVYRGVAEVARNTLECNLHEIEKVLAKMDGAAVSGPGYAPPSAEIPPAMKTDFRA